MTLLYIYAIDKVKQQKQNRKQTKFISTLCDEPSVHTEVVFLIDGKQAKGPMCYYKML